MKAGKLMEVLRRVDPETEVTFENGQPVCSLVYESLGEDKVVLLSEDSANKILDFARIKNLKITT